MNLKRHLGRPVRVWVLAAAILLSLAAGYLIHATVTGEPEPETSAEKQWWICSMHPQIKLLEPGLCPICNMPLVPLETGEQKERGGLRELTVSERAAKLMEIETVPVERRFVEAVIRMVGKVDYDETRVKYITAWIPGRLERLFVDYTGVSVGKGDRMVSLYSPELISTQAELLQAIKAVRELADSESDIVRTTSQATIHAARERLRLWGLTPEQIAEVEQRGEPSDFMTIYAPIGGVVIHKNAQEGMYVKTGTRIYTIADLSTVWVKLDAYESDLMWLRYGQKVEFTCEAYPGRRFTGTISFLDPVLNQDTRTVKVRVDTPNPELLLKPGMFVRGAVKAQVASGGKVMDEALAGKWICPMHPDVVKDAPGQCDICGMELVTTESPGYSGVSPAEARPPLVIPASAALVTGTRAIVYVKLPDREEPTFEGREVVLGPRAGDYYVVRHGLREGWLVVTRGNFRIDAELQIRAQPSMMTPEGGGGGSAHQHGRPAGAAEAAEGGRMTMDMPAMVAARLHKVMAEAGAIDQAVKAEDLGAVQAAFGRLGRAVRAVERESLKGRVAMLWKEYAMLLGNDAFEGEGAADLATARKLAATTREHLDSMSVKMGLTHPAHAAPAPKIGRQFLEQFGAVVQGYLAIQRALAADEAQTARSAAVETLEALGNVDMTLVTGADHMAWMKTSGELKAQLTAVRDAGRIESIRKAFGPLSDAMAAAVKRFGAPTGRLYQFRCPMAFDNRGAIWLQTDEDTRNPYFGGGMLRCGEAAEVIEAAEQKGESDE